MKVGSIFFVNIVIVLFVNSFSFLSAQDSSSGKLHKNTSPVILPEYFLLGILHNSNSLGGHKINEEEIERYNSDEEPLVNYLKEYIQQQFKVDVSVRKYGRNNMVMCSGEVAKKINSLYNEEGFLDIELFDSDEKIASFLLGNYYRVGDKMDKKIYSFLSQYSSNLIYSLLKKAGCSSILYYHTRYYIPGAASFYFEPSSFYRKYFDTIESEREKLHQSRDENSERFSSKEQKCRMTEREKMIKCAFE